MKKFLCLGLAAALCFPAFADKKNGLMRGGWGFVFPDASTFTNGGALSETQTTALSLQYLKIDQSSTQIVTPSLIWGNGHLGLGTYLSRRSAKLDSATDSMDSMGVSGGIALMKDKLTFGFTYDRSLETPKQNDGVLGGQMNLHFGKGDGFTLGGEYTATLNDESSGTLNTMTVGLGYRFNANNYVEADYTVDNTSDSSNYNTMSGSVRVGSAGFYVSGRFAKVKQGDFEPDTASGRIGIISDSVDMYFQYEKVLLTGSSATYGGALRATF